MGSRKVAMLCIIIILLGFSPALNIGGFAQDATIISVSAGGYGPVYSTSYAFDGRLLVDAGGGLLVVDPDDPKPVRIPLPAMQRLLRSAAFNPDGSEIVTAHRDGSIQVWDSYTGQQLRHLDDVMVAYGENRIRPHANAVFSPDGSKLVFADGALCVIDLASGDIIRGHLAKPHGERIVDGEMQVTEWTYLSVEHVAINSDGSLIAIGTGSGDIRLYDGAILEHLHEISLTPGHEADRPQFWPFREMSKSHNSSVVALEFSASGDELFSYSSNRTGWVWDVNTGGVMYEFESHGRPALSHSGSMLAFIDNHLNFVVVDVSTGSILLTGGGSSCIASTFSQDDKSLFDGQRIWDVDSSIVTHTLSHLVWSPYSAAMSFSSGAFVVGGGWDWDWKETALWNLYEDRLIATVDASHPVAVSMSGSTYAAATDGQSTISVYDWESITPVIDLPVKERVHDLYFLNEHRLVSVSWRGSVDVWDLENQQQVLSFAASLIGYVHDSSFSQSGTWLACIDAVSRVLIWNVETGEMHQKRYYDEGAMYSVAVSNDGEHFAASTKSGEVILWNARLDEPMVLSEAATALQSLAFSPDGSILACGQPGGAISLLDSVTGSLTRKIDSTSSHLSLLFSSEGDRLASLSGTGWATIWDLIH